MQQEVIKKRQLDKTYIIDTNVFVNKPDILNYISTDDEVVVSAKVIDELDHLKRNKETSQAVGKAIRNIQSALKRRQIRTDFGKKELLPDEFDKRSPDNLILSMAIMYERKPETNTVLLTSDNGLQLKSKMLGIKAIDLNTFLEESKKKNRINKDTSRNKNNRRRGSRNQNSRNNRKKR
jgi:predicted ribonuclease YlaK